tara:strand:- start:2377 stop:4104 length:1728 start_codon:yes stop_codon:yes gene_type:complete
MDLELLFKGKKLIFHTNNLESSLKKIALSRIFIGLICSIKYLQVIQYLFIIEVFDLKFLIASLLLLCYSLITIGFITPIISVLLIITKALADKYLGIWNLGDLMMTIFLMIFILTNANQYFSIDRWIKTRFKISIFNPFNVVYNKEDVQKVFQYSFLIYAIVSLGAIMLHLNDYNWLHLNTVNLLLINPYLSSYSELFISIKNSYPVFYKTFGNISTFSQTFFQLFMIPLMFNRLGRTFIYVWGILFFLLSTLLLQLSFLPIFEIAFWFLIFNLNRNKVEIFFDDYCNLCKKTMKFFSMLNYNNQFIFSPLSKNSILIQNQSLRDIKTYITIRIDGAFYQGYDSYIVLFRRTSLLWPFLPLLIIGKWVGIGPKIYSHISLRRLALFGICEVSYNNDLIDFNKLNISKKPYFRAYYQQLIFLVLLVFIINEFHYSPFNGIIKTKYINYAGLQIPDVFNSTDLKMNNNYFVIRNNSDNKLVRFTAEDGGRLSYRKNDFILKNHYSDNAYFGNSLFIRRYSLGLDSIFIDEPKILKKLKSQILFDYKFHNYAKEKEYEIFHYKNNITYPIGSTCLLFR